MANGEFREDISTISENGYYNIHNQVLGNLCVSTQNTWVWVIILP